MTLTADCLLHMLKKGSPITSRRSKGSGRFLRQPLFSKHGLTLRALYQLDMGARYSWLAISSLWSTALRDGGAYILSVAAPPKEGGYSFTTPMLM